MKGFESYKHLKFKPMCQLKYNNGDVTNVLIPLCRICVEYIKLDTCAKFDDHQRNKNNVMIEGEGVLMTDVSKKPMSNRVNGARFYYNLNFINAIMGMSQTFCYHCVEFV